jgi:hypothetical protein
MTDEELYNPNLTPPSMSSQFDMRALFDRSGFATLHSRSHQILFLADYSAPTLERPLKTREPAEVFDVTQEPPKEFCRGVPKTRVLPAAVVSSRMTSSKDLFK